MHAAVAFMLMLFFSVLFVAGGAVAGVGLAVALEALFGDWWLLVLFGMIFGTAALLWLAGGR